MTSHDAAILDDLENGDGLTDSQRIMANSRGVARLLRGHFAHDKRLNLHERLLLLILASAMGVGGSAVVGLLVVVVTRA